MTRNTALELAIPLAVMGRWLATGNSSTVAEIAADVGASPAKVRETVSGAISPRLQYDQVERPVFSRDYPGMILRHRLVDAYRPSDALLRDTIRGLQTAKES